MRKFVLITTSFVATHHWPECNITDVIYLRHIHRHRFTVKMRFPVTHNDRQIEFILKKMEVDAYLKKYDNKYLGKMSCEDIAEELLKHFEANAVEVMEDGENGVVIYED